MGNKKRRMVLTFQVCNGINVHLRSLESGVNMAKNYGNINCFNDLNGGKHILADYTCNALCGEKFVANCNYYGRKDYILRRNIDAVTCQKCKELYMHNKSNVNNGINMQ